MRRNVRAGGDKSVEYSEIELLVFWHYFLFLPGTCPIGDLANASIGIRLYSSIKFLDLQRSIGIKMTSSSVIAAKKRMAAVAGLVAPKRKQTKEKTGSAARNVRKTVERAFSTKGTS